MDMSDRLEDMSVEMKIYGQIFSATNKIQAMGDKLVNELTMRQQYLLLILSKFDSYAPTLQELAALFGSSYQNVKRMAMQLEENHYLEIRKDLIDRRKIRIILNRKKFNAVKDRFADYSSEFFDKIYEGISAEDLAVMAKVIDKVNENVDAYEHADNE